MPSREATWCAWIFPMHSYGRYSQERKGRSNNYENTLKVSGMVGRYCTWNLLGACCDKKLSKGFISGSIKSNIRMLEAALLWYRKFLTDLESIWFCFHDYYPCIAMKMVGGFQHLIRIHVDDIFASHKLAKVNDDFAVWENKKYWKLKPVEVKRWRVFEFLGMTLNFETPGECHVLQEEKVEDLISFWPEEI